ncbi:hypothetical protein TWF506_002530 [Arthrobotrys conoides]|uniref:Xylanolytic transcriptional activator regulatory domain-containing protein n=1 Tax=Arthrobotrys conoides TaxID=74498 RepID=A0AAN8RUW4_9PEZI
MIAPKHQELLSRLRNLEDMVSQLRSQVENAAIGGVSNDNKDDVDSLSAMEDVVQLGTPSASSGGLFEKTQSNTPQEPDNMILESNGDLIVGDRFWTIFCGEVERIFEAARGPEPYSFEMDHKDSNIELDSHSRSHINYYNFLLRQADAAAKYDLTHPHPSQLLLLWQTYVDDIDPFIKILHVPSVTRLIRDLRGQYHSLKPDTEALIFAISLAAVSISTEEDISQHFNTTKQELLSRYRLYTEQAFEEARILTSDSIESLQALVIYIYSLRSTEDQKLIWALSGTLLKIALRLNLHNDLNPTIGTNSLERETRRRLWWQVCLTDSTSNAGITDVSEFQISEDMFKTQIPSNTDDANISSSILDIQAPTPERTDLTIFLIRCEIWRFSRRLQTLLNAQEDIQKPPEDPIELFKRTQTQITESHIKHLRPDIPLDSFVNIMTQLFFSKVELRLLETHRPCNHKTPPNPQLPSQNKPFKLALSILNDTYSLQHEPSWKPWRWHIKDQTPPYHALSIVLKTIRHQPWDSTFEQALPSAINSINTIPDGTHQHRHFINLLASAQSCRDNYFPQKSTLSDIQIITPRSDIDLSTSPSTHGHDGSIPALYTNDFDFTMFGDSGTSTSTNLQAWDDMVNSFEPWDFGDIAGI